ncbi:hypothetical protein TIFTF001_046092 [Ficus carica]|nr:hypothetical protein TIFTF001_046088 [Ficus carica]GMN26811.1 hypothetical protein TIFTF001_046092 [Ficus carica]
MANQAGRRGACPVTVCWLGMLMGVKCGASGRAVTPVAEKSGGWAERCLHVAHDPDSHWHCPGPKLRPGSSSVFSQDREGSANGPSGWSVRPTCSRFLPSPRNAGVRGPSGSTGRCHTVKHGVSCLAIIGPKTRGKKLDPVTIGIRARSASWWTAIWASVLVSWRI